LALVLDGWRDPEDSLGPFSDVHEQDVPYEEPVRVRAVA